MIARILVPTDFSAPSLRALDYAAGLAKRLVAELIVIHAVEPVYYPVAGDAYGVGVDLGNVYDEVERAAAVQLKRLGADIRERGVPVRTLLCHGTAHEVVLKAAKRHKAGLIVMSTQGRTGLSHLLLGSVAERVLRTATCPVLTVPPLPQHRPKRARQRLADSHLPVDARQ